MEPLNNLPVNTGSAVNPKTYSTAGGVTTVRPVRFFGIFAIAGVIIMTVTVLIVMLTRTDQNNAIYAIVLVAALGAPLFAFSFVQRYYLDNEKIVHRNMLGIKKQLFWKDIKTVSVNPFSPTNVKLYGSGKKIKVYPSFYFGSGSELILKFIRKHFADAEWK
jgi:hypothetical protein